MTGGQDEQPHDRQAHDRQAHDRQAHGRTDNGVDGVDDTVDDGVEDPADVVRDQAFWDERYRSKITLWSGSPNPHLVNEVADLTPGTALDVGCGEGADAIWLAEHGWQVTAVDISPVALERAAANAEDVGKELAQRITWLHADLTEEATASSAYDLVTVQFLHLPSAQRGALHRHLAASVAPGGTLLIVAHHPSDLRTTIPRPPEPDLFFTADEVAATLPADDWTIVAAEARPRLVLDPEGTPTTIHDTVLRARRKG